VDLLPANKDGDSRSELRFQSAALFNPHGTRQTLHGRDEMVYQSQDLSWMMTSIKTVEELEERLSRPLTPAMAHLDGIC
jgi:hypothetical protein